MIIVDIAAIILTICIAGLRYPGYVLLAALLHDLASILITLVFHGRIESIVAAGAFGTTMASGIATTQLYLIIFSGCIANYIIGNIAGGLEYEKTATIVNPLASVKHPFAVVNLRLAALSLLAGAWQIIGS